MKYYRWRWFLGNKKVWRILGLGVLGLLAVLVWQIEQRDIKIWNWTVGSKTVVIDAGHGGVDPGAVGKNETLEKDVTLAVAQRLQVLMEQGGAKVVMVREDDRDLGSAQGLLQRKREDLAQRLQLALEAEADIYLSIHANSFPDERLSGPQVFYYADSEEGKALAKALQLELNTMVGGHRVAKGNRDFFILKKATQAAVTIEVGFLSNPAEEQQLIDSDYQQKLALAIYQGVIRYYNEYEQAQGTITPLKDGP